MRWSRSLGIVLMLVALSMTPETTRATDRYEPLKSFSQVMDLIEKTYVNDVQRQELVQGAIQGMLQSLDPHSGYLDQEEFKDMQAETSGEFSGVGIEITLQNGRLTVVSPVEDTPAFRAGLQSGDIILEIDGESTQDISIMDAVHKIRGPKGSEVELTVLHQGEAKPERITLKRDVIPMQSVKIESMEPGYLYVRITNFNENTTKDLRQALREHRPDLEGVVLDLRNNPGGLLDQAVSVADMFLGQGKIVYTQGKVRQAKMDFQASDQQSDIMVPIVVLINSGTASASEIVAGAIQDHKRGLILGVRSFGKGSVQTVIPLPDGAGIKLTTAKYYTPSGRSIQAEGITPDISLAYNPIEEEAERSVFRTIRERDLARHLENGEDNEAQDQDQDQDQDAESENTRIERMLEKDNQLQMALQLVKRLPMIKGLQ
ncbi:S41 family peptidase [Desulfovermiculus halophilus]|uniref:S41 family peptidase n=1 Tax=Desulfovermiculus halophilus TaxID=339722 RepID=UPI000489BA60|nr:S41 family peptidase [Desulfovermiculus halophilus]